MVNYQLAGSSEINTSLKYGNNWFIELVVQNETSKTSITAQNHSPLFTRNSKQQLLTLELDYEHLWLCELFEEIYRLMSTWFNFTFKICQRSGAIEAKTVLIGQKKKCSRRPKSKQLYYYISNNFFWIIFTKFIKFEINKARCLIEHFWLNKTHKNFKYLLMQRNHQLMLQF